jgi:hypothetical protein
MTFRGSRGALGVLTLLGAFAVFSEGGCARELTLGSDRVSTAAAAGVVSGSSGGAGVSGVGGGAGNAGTLNGAAGEAPCVVSPCHDKIYLCGNCIDDDHDGRIDADDPECTGPCDNLEDSLSVGLPGEGSAACQEDCYFDSGNGSGGEDCRYSLRCDPHAISPDYPPSGDASCAYDENAKIPGTGASCSELHDEQPAGCLENCGPLTPNGCDCFGCCEVPAGSGSYLWLETSLPCEPVSGCLNTCEPCETCVGRPAPLPSCTDTGAACPVGYRGCGGTSETPCQPGAYCITGCCIPEPR